MRLLQQTLDATCSTLLKKASAALLSFSASARLPVAQGSLGQKLIACGFVGVFAVAPVLQSNAAAVLPRTSGAGAPDRVLNVADFPGADPGAMITAADSALGSETGMIVVGRPLLGRTVRSSPIVTAHHTLILCTPLTWSASARPKMASGARIIGCEAASPQTIQSTGSWIDLSGVTEIEIGNLHANWSTPLGADNGNRILKCSACSRVFLHDLDTIRGGWILTTSATDDYNTTNLAANGSHDIVLRDNNADGITGPCLNRTGSINPCEGGANIYAAFYKYTSNIWEENSVCMNLSHCRFVWGGNNTSKFEAFPGDWASMDPNMLKASNVYWDTLHCTNVQACEVMSMANNVVTTGAIDNMCSDVCEDAEGAHNVQITNFNVTASKNGELSVFTHSAHILFGPGKVNHTAKTSWFTDQVGKEKSYSLYLRNETNNSNNLTDITVTGVVFECHRSDGQECYGATYDTGDRIRFINNTFINTPVYSGMTTSGEMPGVEFTGNEFRQTITDAVGPQSTPGNPVLYSLDISSHLLDRTVLRNNRFINAAPQHDASAAIFKGDYLNGSLNGSNVALDMQANVVRDWKNAMVLTNVGPSTCSVTPVYHSEHNNFGAGAVLLQPNGSASTYQITDMSTASNKN